MHSEVVMSDVWSASPQVVKCSIESGTTWPQYSKMSNCHLGKCLFTEACKIYTPGVFGDAVLSRQQPLFLGHSGIVQCHHLSLNNI